MATAKVKLLYFKRTVNDSRDTASDVGTMVVCQAGAVRFAQAIENGDLHCSWPAGFRPGHGITLQYASGRLRNIHAER